MEKQVMKKSFSILVQGLACAALFACGGPEITTGETSDIPKWALTPPGAAALGFRKSGNLGLAQKTSEARGRDALARQLQTKVQGMIKDYQQSGEAEQKTSPKNSLLR